MPAQHSFDRLARRLALALHRFTRVRLRGVSAGPAAALDEEQVGASALPGVGWVVGMAACLSFAIVSVALRASSWNPAVAAIASTAVTVLLTGALHEIAFARTVDRIASPAASPHAATLALVLLLAGKLALLGLLATASAVALMATLFAAHVISRYAPLLVADWLRAGTRLDRGALRRSALWCVVPLLLMVLAGGVAAMVLALIAGALGTALLLRLGGDTLRDFDDDALGAVQQVCELAFYAGAALAVA